jgi:hypothetical protein
MAWEYAVRTSHAPPPCQACCLGLPPGHCELRPEFGCPRQRPDFESGAEALALQTLRVVRCGVQKLAPALGLRASAPRFGSNRHGASAGAATRIQQGLGKRQLSVGAIFPSRKERANVSPQLRGSGSQGALKNLAWRLLHELGDRRRSLGVSPLTPALSPLRGEGDLAAPMTPVCNPPPARCFHVLRSSHHSFLAAAATVRGPAMLGHPHRGFARA